MVDIPPSSLRVVVHEPALSWSAIIAGALTALAVSVLLTLVAMGLGWAFSWSGFASPASLAAFTPAMGAGTIVIQVLSAALGGYLAGRLRHGWTTAHLDEAHFRDTAHGLIAWALATIAGLILAVAVLGPWTEGVVAATTPAPVGGPTVAANAGRILTQSALFTGLGMLLAAFVASAAARLGGLRTEEMIEQAQKRRGAGPIAPPVSS
jgi:hypothetical protein